jgi:hypothetical protein
VPRFRKGKTAREIAAEHRESAMAGQSKKRRSIKARIHPTTLFQRRCISPAEGRSTRTRRPEQPEQ